MNGSFNIRTRQVGSGRVGHKCADRRYDVKGCRCMNGSLMIRLDSTEMTARRQRTCTTAGEDVPYDSCDRLSVSPCAFDARRNRMDRRALDAGPPLLKEAMGPTPKCRHTHACGFAGHEDANRHGTE
eukprot:1400030-Prymnesium_polylepis.1